MIFGADARPTRYSGTIDDFTQLQERLGAFDGVPRGPDVVRRSCAFSPAYILSRRQLSARDDEAASRQDAISRARQAGLPPIERNIVIRHDAAKAARFSPYFLTPRR